MPRHPRRRLSLTPFLTLSVLTCGGSGRGEPADVVLLGGVVFTMDTRAPRAEAVVIRQGRIAFVGSDAEAERWVGPSTRVVVLEGRTVLPAFVDGHIHPVTGGVEQISHCDLSGESRGEAILRRVEACAAARPDGWLLGVNWQLPAFHNAAPTKESLDRIAPDRPAYLTAADHHSAWVNSEALRMAGISRATPDPPGGLIERGPNGEPSGTLRETAMHLVGDLVPKPTAADREAGLRHTLGLLHRAGVTSLLEAAADRPILAAYRAVERSGGLTGRVLVAMRADPAGGPAQVDSFVAWRTEFGSDRLRPEVVKVFLDGVIEARTAAMLAPYTDRPGWAGVPRWSAEGLDSLATRAVAAGFSLHVHAIGDRAVRMALDAIEHAEQGRDRGMRRHAITHLQIIDAVDVPRFAALDVISVFQPLWAYPDSYIRDLTWPALGPERSQRIYPIGDIVRANGRLAFASDWNVTSLVPLDGIQVSVTRQDPDDSTGPILIPDEAVTVPTALRAYTLGAAYSLGLEDLVGSIVVGKAADLVVLSADPLEVAPHRLARISVLLTTFEGAPVHGSWDLTAPATDSAQ